MSDNQTGSKRNRNAMDGVEDQLEFHHRQLSITAIDRATRYMKNVPPTHETEPEDGGVELRQRLRPIDLLTFQFQLHYADREIMSSKRVVETVAESILRLSHPQLFDPIPVVKYISSLGAEELTRLATDVHDLTMSVKALERGSAEEAAAEAGAFNNAAPVRSADSERLLETNKFWAVVDGYLKALEANAAADEALAKDAEGEGGDGSMHKIYEGHLLELLDHGRDRLSEVAAQLSALAAVGEAEGPDGAVNARFYKAAHAMCVVLAAENAIESYEAEVRHESAPMVPKHVLEDWEKQLEAMRLAAGTSGDNYDMSERDALLTMEGAGDALRDDEDVFMGELVDYAAKQKQIRDKRNAHQEARAAGEVLEKPRRYCKVRAGYIWNNYNKTHYDMRTNPPPRQVLGYEFNLYYPLIAKDRNRKPEYVVEPTELGWSDEFCIIVFKAGPPYLDVAFRIVNKKWDARPNAVNCFFDDNGRFRLYFRFQPGGYRR